MGEKMKIHVTWLDKGEWKVSLITVSASIPLGCVSVTADGHFSASTQDGRKVQREQRLCSAAKALAVREIGYPGNSITVLLPFEDGSGP